MGEEADADWQAGLSEWGYADAKRAELDAAFAAREKELRRKERDSCKRKPERKSL